MQVTKSHTKYSKSDKNSTYIGLSLSIHLKFTDYSFSSSMILSVINISDKFPPIATICIPFVAKRPSK